MLVSSVFALAIFTLSYTKSKVLLYLSFLLLFLLSAFRNVDVGTDTANYLEYFLYLKNGGQDFVEPFWVVMNKGIIFLDGNFEHVLILSSFAVLAPLFYTIKRNSVNPLLSIFFYFTLYFYFFSFNITRQLIAVSIVLLAITYLQENRKKFIITVVLASLFHYSAIVILALLFVKKVPEKLNFYILSIGFAMIVGIVFPEFITLIVEETGYGKYLARFSIGNIMGNLLYVIFLNSFFLLVYFFSRGSQGLYFKIFYLFVLISNFTVRLPLNERVVLYFAVIQILLFPLILKTVSSKHKIFLTLVMVFYAFAIFFKNLGAGGIFPYTNSLL